MLQTPVPAHFFFFCSISRELTCSLYRNYTAVNLVIVSGRYVTSCYQQFEQGQYAKSLCHDDLYLCARTTIETVGLLNFTWKAWINSWHGFSDNFQQTLWDFFPGLIKSVNPPPPAGVSWSESHLASHLDR